MSVKLSDHIEKTLVLLKPDAIERGLVGEILKRFENIGLKIVAIKMAQASKEQALNHYPNSEAWIKGMGEKSLEDYKNYNIDPKELHGTDDALEIGKMIRDFNVDYLSGGPIIALILEGLHSIQAVRKLIGNTKPLSADPGTIRGDFSTVSSLSSNIANVSIKNLIHASGNKEEAEYEIKHWFKNNELFDYEIRNKVI